MNSNPGKPREYCGLCGVSGGTEILERTYIGLHALQHRGQEASGIMVAGDGKCRLHRGKGLVDDVFGRLPEKIRKQSVANAISHVRYSTAGIRDNNEAQPLMVDMGGYEVGIAHNGTICNAGSLHSQLQQEGAIFQSTADTELILHLMARSLLKRHNGDVWDALAEALQQVKGAYSLLLMTTDEVAAVRDPQGFRPLNIGRFPDGSYMIASETISFNVTGAEFVREVEPGEIVLWDRQQQMRSKHFSESSKRAQCIFEHVYFSRPGSNVFGDDVSTVRKRMGRQLAEEAPVDADLIMPVPDSGMFAALGYAEASELPFDMGFTRNHYVGRTFIDPGLKPRQGMVSRKLQPIPEAVKGKRLCLIEDSIVRGSTSRARIHTLREVGAKEVHMRVSCPPHKFGCYFGIDFPEPEELIANKMSIDKLAESLSLDSLAYLSQDGMLSCVSAYAPEDYCCACFDGNYPVIPEWEARSPR
ncbi:MAG: amidophosphoribosyltransferase [Verrucomicrobiota bacterium]